MLDGAVTYIRQNPKATLGLSAVVITIAQLVQLPWAVPQLRGTQPMPPAPGGTGPAGPGTLPGTVDIAGGAGSVVVSALATLVLTGMLTSVMGQAVLGRRVSAGEAWRRTRPRIWMILGAAVLITLIVAGAGVVLVTPGVLVAVFASPGGGAALAILGLLAWIAFAVWIGVTFVLAIPAIVLENLGVRAGLRRSRELVRGSWWRVFGIMALAGLIAGAIQVVLFLPFLGAAIGLGAATAGSGVPLAVVTVVGALAGTVGGIIAGTVARPFAAGVPALLYVDRRMRQEGFDMQLRNAAGVVDPRPPPAG